MGKRIAYFCRIVRGVVQSRVFRYGARLLVGLAVVGAGFLLWHKWYTTIPGLAGEIYFPVDSASYCSAIARLAALPEEERLQVLEVLLRSPGAKYHDFTPGAGVIHAIVGLDHDGSFSRRLVDQVVIPALDERPLPYLRNFHPSAMADIARTAARAIVRISDPDDYFQRVLGLINLAAYLEVEDLAQIGTQVVQAVANDAVPSEYDYAFSLALRLLSPYVDEKSAVAWGEQLLASLEQSTEADLISDKLFTLYKIATPLDASAVDAWAERAWKVLEAQEGVEEFRKVAGPCVLLSHYTSDSMKFRLSELLLERMATAGGSLYSLSKLVVDQSYPPLNPETITAAGELLLSRALTVGSSSSLEELGKRASEAALSSWSSRLLQEVRVTNDVERKSRIREVLYSLLREVQNREFDYSVVVQLDEIQHGEATYWNRVQWHTFAKAFEYIEPRLSEEIKKELRQLLIEKLSSESTSTSLPPMAEALALMSTNMPALDLLPLAQELLDRAMAYPAVDFEDALDVLDALSMLAIHLPPMPMEKVGDALLTFELLESVLCERPPSSLFEITSPRLQAPKPARRGDPGVERSARILGRLARNLSGARSSAWGARVLEYMARNEEKGRPGVQRFLAELAPSASEAEAQLWGQVTLDTILNTESTRDSSYNDLLTLAAHAPGFDVRPAIERLLLTESFSGASYVSPLPELLSLPQVPVDYKAALWNRIPRKAPGNVENQERYVEDKVEFWINTRPPVSSESERSRQAQQCIDFLADPLVATWVLDEVIEYLGYLAGKDFSAPRPIAGWREPLELIVHRALPGDLWKVLDWATSPEGQGLGVKVPRNAQFSDVWSAIPFPRDTGPPVSRAFTPASS